MATFEEPAVIAACITGLVAFFTFVSNSVLIIKGKRFERKNSFEITLKEKLEKIYSPLYYLFYRNQDGKIFDKKSLELIQKYGHLLSYELLGDINLLITRESQRDKILDRDHQELKRMIYKKLQAEYLELQRLADKHFRELKMKYRMNIIDTILLSIVRTIVLLTGLFWLLAGVSRYYNFVKNNTPVDTVFYAIIVPITLLVLITTLFILVYIIQKFWDAYVVRVGKRKRLFTSKEYVPVTHNYQCTACGGIKGKNVYSEFENCEIKHNFLQSMKRAIFNHQWRKI
ncbi:hypothetical protein M3650_21715 [Paenibacillus sp. MER TA 81-3]|uniref:hypothetical protein n=1 Tax=Paenibacillus sp. MER TA 81-3 TaxID=2939573 RepID=UPI00203B0DDC|nr:hypothetical protein [Paenibacillus sp. MER TA 81-3]MCM3341177.1 hypothetical protein [Paenibacillus sp. MER TA 81-3]